MNKENGFLKIWQEINNDIQIASIRPNLTSHGYLLLKVTEKSIKEYIKDGKVLDLSAGDLRYKDVIKNCNCEYISTEISKKKVDVRCDAHKLPFKNESFDAVICSQVLEHLQNPHVAISEIGRILRIKGTLILTVPMSIYIHEAPHDYYRFTEYGIKSLLNSNQLNLNLKKEICSVYITLLELIQILVCVIIYKVSYFPFLRRSALFVFSIISKIISYFDIPILRKMFPSNLIYIVTKVN